MNKRFKYLVQKFLENELEGSEVAEFDKYLKDPLCSDYLRQAEKANKIIEKGFRLIQAEIDKKESSLPVTDIIEKEIEEDILRYGGANVRPETLDRVRKLHENMLAGKKRTRLIIYGSVAAAVVTGIIIFFTLSFHQTPKKLYAQYYKPHFFLVTRGVSEDRLKYKNAVSDYMLSNYSESALACKQILSSGSQEPEIYFLYGLSLMGLDSMQSAIRQFNTITSLPIDRDGSLFVSSYWYESLCYLSLGKTDSALVKFEVIRGMDNMFSSGLKVEELVKGIEGL